MKRIVIVLLVILVILALAFIFLMPRHQQVGALDLSFVPDGAYLGAASNGIIAAEVKVSVVQHHITEIDLISHRTGMGQEAEAILPRVVEQQSLQVDAISGATLSSSTILKAIENALTQEGTQ